MNTRSKRPATHSLVAQLRTMRDALLATKARKPILWSILGILLVIVATAIGQILLNRWNKPFFNSIQQRDVPEFFRQLGVFAVIASGLLLLNIGQLWLNQFFQLKLRQAITLDLIKQWLSSRHASRFAHAGAIGVNPDQRMQQDAAHLTDLTGELGVGILQAFVLLISFIGVLWQLSAGFAFHVNGRSIEIPGYMVWAALLYAGSASYLSWLMGRPLIELDSDRYSKEAELRHAMININEHPGAIAHNHSEDKEQTRLTRDLDILLAAIWKIFTAQIHVAWVTSGYGWLTQVAPILIAAPVYFSGAISFGGLMMAVGAFNQVNTSLLWFVNNIAAIADWRATLMRVTDFRMALTEADDTRHRGVPGGYKEQSKLPQLETIASVEKK